ncbi:hypothetical protein BUALT_Bualt03G0121600 [Buddleja alternifolia]|uniref:Uncharacterized protein n=1 Tax=Buddleja alternifolia TaxID=168488 RepID=A0AAV6XTU0_9LAMI|nr:hypothetical protein BUALT_Bualt03G0121600 [Buddleja alternifolia]
MAAIGRATAVDKESATKAGKRRPKAYSHGPLLIKSCSCDIEREDAFGHRYTQRKKEDISGHVVEERAPSTAEEFERVAEEKSRQGFASQTTEKAADGAVEATVEDDSTFESVKEAQKEFPPGKGDFHKKGHE